MPRRRSSRTSSAWSATCEKLFGPYRWGRYDLLILPPSAPFGGMENPRLSFITPTVIAGDKSLVSLIAHELAHSWSGNLVTNATWRDFWLNEGFTVYLERRIVEALYGKRREQMEDVLGLQSLRRDLADLDRRRTSTSPSTCAGSDPDDGVTRRRLREGQAVPAVPREPLRARAVDAFLRGYFDHFAFQSIYTEQFLDYLRANLLRRSRAPSRSSSSTRGSTSRASRHSPCCRSAGRVRAGRRGARRLAGGQRSPPRSCRRQSWSTQEWLHFLDNMPATLPRARLDELDKTFSLSASAQCRDRAQLVPGRHPQRLRAGLPASSSATSRPSAAASSFVRSTKT